MSGRSGATRKLAANPPRELLTGTYNEHISEWPCLKVVSEAHPPMPESGHPTCPVMTYFLETEFRDFKGLLLISFRLARAWTSGAAEVLLQMAETAESAAQVELQENRGSCRDSANSGANFCC